MLCWFDGSVWLCGCVCVCVLCVRLCLCVCLCVCVCVVRAMSAVDGGTGGPCLEHTCAWTIVDAAGVAWSFDLTRFCGEPLYYGSYVVSLCGALAAVPGAGCGSGAAAAVACGASGCGNGCEARAVREQIVFVPRGGA